MRLTAFFKIYKMCTFLHRNAVFILKKTLSFLLLHSDTTDKKFVLPPTRGFLEEYSDYAKDGRAALKPRDFEHEASRGPRALREAAARPRAVRRRAP